MIYLKIHHLKEIPKTHRLRVPEVHKEIQDNKIIKIQFTFCMVSELLSYGFHFYQNQVTNKKKEIDIRNDLNSLVSFSLLQMCLSYDI